MRDIRIVKRELNEVCEMLRRNADPADALQLHKEYRKALQIEKFELEKERNAINMYEG